MRASKILLFVEQKSLLWYFFNSHFFLLLFIFFKLKGVTNILIEHFFFFTILWMLSCCCCNRMILRYIIIYIIWGERKVYVHFHFVFHQLLGSFTPRIREYVISEWREDFMFSKSLLGRDCTYAFCQVTRNKNWKPKINTRTTVVIFTAKWKFFKIDKLTQKQIF